MKVGLIALVMLSASGPIAGGEPAFALISVPGSAGSHKGYVLQTAVPGFRGNPVNWTSVFCSVYLPKTGNAWAGGPETVNHVVLVDDALMGFCYDAGSRGQLIVDVSTNRYTTGREDISQVLQSELHRYTNVTATMNVSPAYFLSLEAIFGERVCRDLVDDPARIGKQVYDLTARPSELISVSAEGTNAVVSVRYGTNILAKIAFNAHMVPVWATTNGVSIGAIPKKTVFFQDTSSGKLRAVN